jgi:carbamoyl-phosphate synthase large subunit
MVKAATRVMLGQSLREQGYGSGLLPPRALVAIKAPVFSMQKLAGVDTYLGPEMKSTGEVMGVDRSYPKALAKALLAAGLALPPSGAVLLSIGDRDKAEAVPIVKALGEASYNLYATEGTAAMIRALGLPVTQITKKLSEGHPNVVDVIQQRTVHAVVNTMSGNRSDPLRDGFYIRRAAAEARIPCFTSLDTARVAAAALKAVPDGYNVLPLSEYLRTPAS